MTTATKRCPGFAPDGTLPHEVPADLEHYNSNKGSKDGLATRCKPCGNKYGKAWTAAKAKGEKFSVKANVPLSVVLAEEPAQELTHPNGEPVFTATAAQVAQREGEPATLSVATVKSGPEYHDDLAVRAARGRAEGYTTEEIDGVIYALPINGSAETPEGQAALEAINAATVAARRRRDRDRKREQRAAAKAAQA